MTTGRKVQRATARCSNNRAPVRVLHFRLQAWGATFPSRHRARLPLPALPVSFSRSSLKICKQLSGRGGLREMGAAWEMERLASREGGSAKVVSGATRDFGPTRRQERPYSGFAFWQSPVSLSNVKAAVSVERSACAKRARPWVGAQQRPVLRPVNNTAPRHLRSVRGGWLRRQRYREVKKGLAPFTPRIDLALQCRWERCSLLSTCGQKKKNLLSFSGREPNGTAAGGHAKYPCRLSGGFSVGSFGFCLLAITLCQP
ncbi:hypothetical protein Q8A73_016827 [Channa argus]|nr:hypothetical protein Q8A73_016827 [Channa argus]